MNEWMNEHANEHFGWNLDMLEKYKNSNSLPQHYTIEHRIQY